MRRHAFGWDNVVFRLGDHLVARLPRRAAAVPLAEHEHRWLPELAVHLPLPVPAPTHVGAPGAGYPWVWSICRWFAGQTAAVHPPADLDAAAEQMAGFVESLHVPTPGRSGSAS